MINSSSLKKQNGLQVRHGVPAKSRIMGAIKRPDDGVATIEFAIIAPVFLSLLVGIFDIGQMAYANAVLDGAVQQAARSSSLETADTTAADAMVEAAVTPVLPNVDIGSTRVSYFDFADIGRPEQFNDANDDGACNDGEAYTDENRSGAWDADIAVTGNGGAGDVVIYTVNATYDPIFKIPFMPDSWGSRTLTSKAVRKNQPFADQTGYGSTAGVCD
jgi:hypothetical protein